MNHEDQFPPVASSRSEALYYPVNMLSDKWEAQIGRVIYEEFTTVVILKEQMRVVDEEWRDLLRHLRYGRMQPKHIEMLKTLVINNPSCPETNFGAAPWSDVFLVTPRHGVRRMWNEAAIRRHCASTGGRLFVCPAEDRIKGRTLNLPERYALANRAGGKGRRRQKDLPVQVEFAVGAQVLVTQNIETDLDVTNGARGEIVDVVLHPDEPDLPDTPIVQLVHMPVYILVKLKRTRASTLDGLDAGVIPIEPAVQSMRVNVNTPDGKNVSRTIKRRQLPLTAAWAFTDYRAQGQTIPCVLVDIARPPTGGLDLFNLYVALSRGKGRQGIRILREFDESLFLTSHAVELLAEDDRLNKLDQETNEWWKNMMKGSSVVLERTVSE